MYLGPTDDITRFEYMQKTNKENGPALVGVELQSKDDYESADRKDERLQYWFYRAEQKRHSCSVTWCN